MHKPIRILFKINCSWLYDHVPSLVYFDIALLNYVNVDVVSLTNLFLEFIAFCPFVIDFVLLGCEMKF